MADEKNLKLAKSTYQALLKAIELNEWRCSSDDEDMSICFSVTGDDLEMPFVVLIDADRQLIRLFSKLPFCFEGNKIIDGAVAVSVANYAIADGCFDIDLDDGSVMFKMTSGFMESIISPDALRYMVNYASFTVDEFNDKFLMISNGSKSIKSLIDEYSE